jgi:hypothetical protein
MELSISPALWSLCELAWRCPLLNKGQVLMSFFAFTPSRLEIVNVEGFPTRNFGRGKLAAQKLAQKISFMPPENRILIYGWATTLDPKIRVGNSFLIRELKLEKAEKQRLEIPRSLEFLPRASLHTLGDSEWKATGSNKNEPSSDCQLVDGEMGYLMDALADQHRQRILIVRTVILSGLTSYRRLKMTQNYWSYRSNCREFLEKLRLGLGPH